MLVDNLRQVGRAHCPFGAVDGISGNEGLSVTNLEYHVSAAFLYVGKCFGISGFLSGKDEVAALLNAVYDALSGVVNIYHADADVLHLLVHDPRHDAHNHDGEHDDEPGQEGVAPDLQKLFLY